MNTPVEKINFSALNNGQNHFVTSDKQVTFTAHVVAGKVTALTAVDIHGKPLAVSERRPGITVVGPGATCQACITVGNVTKCYPVDCSNLPPVKTEFADF